MPGKWPLLSIQLKVAVVLLMPLGLVQFAELLAPTASFTAVNNGKNRLWQCPWDGVFKYIQHRVLRNQDDWLDIAKRLQIEVSVALYSSAPGSDTLVT